MIIPKSVQIKEVGPRDGLQNEKVILSTTDKVSIVNRLAETGLHYIEVTSFVSPKWMSQLADADQVFRLIERKEGITYAALVPNQKGLARALEANIDEVNVFLSASEGHNQKNINKSIAETYPVLREVVAEAIAAGKSVRAYISTAIACPYDGPTKPEKVLAVAEQLLQMGVGEISLGDTIGVGIPTDVERLLEAVLKEIPVSKIAMHFHDTNGMALANVMKSIEYGITTFDSAVGGIGGCPYAKGATGNVATEDLLYLLNRLGIKTGVDFDKVINVSHFLESKIGRKLTSKQLDISRGEQGWKV